MQIKKYVRKWLNYIGVFSTKPSRILRHLSNFLNVNQAKLQRFNLHKTVRKLDQMLVVYFPICRT